MKTRHWAGWLAMLAVLAAACVVEEPAADDDDDGSSSTGDPTSSIGGAQGVGGGAAGVGGASTGSGGDRGFDNPPCPNSETVMDADGNVYPTVQLGAQCWMAADLNRGVAKTSLQYCNAATDCDGQNEQCNHGQCSGPLNDTYVYKFCQNNDVPCGSCAAYRFHEAMQGGNFGAKGICPSGWHVATQSDWQILASAYAGRSNELLRFFGHSGFEARLCGYKRDATTNWDGISTFSMFWAGTSATSTEAYRVTIERDEPNLRIAPVDMNFGHYVRCVMD